MPYGTVYRNVTSTPLGMYMVIDHISLPMKLVFGVIKFVPYVVNTMNNYWKRPKLKLSVSTTDIEFFTSEGQKQLPSFLSITIENLESFELHLDLNKANLNGESLGYIIQQNIFFARTNEGTKSEVKLSTKNVLLNLFRENWITSKFLKIPPYEILSIPFFPKGMSDTIYFRNIENPKVFFPKNKFIVSLCINSSLHHYAVGRFELVKRLVNVLVHS
jgi:hypothetical protein